MTYALFFSFLFLSCSEAELNHSLEQNWQNFKYSFLRRSLLLRLVGGEQTAERISTALMIAPHDFKRRESRGIVFLLFDKPYSVVYPCVIVFEE